MRIVILSGAGLSAESGQGTFRDRDGIWSRFDPARLATPEAFARDPDEVHAFYNLRRAGCLDAAPNAAHHALARLERDGRHIVCHVTQNVDDLSERAGGAPVKMHGTLLGALCAACGHRWPAPRRMSRTDPCPACARQGTRPDIVWFGEMPHRMDDIAAALDAADMFVAIGTSGAVYPAAGFVAAVPARAKRVEINLAQTDVSGAFDRHIPGPASVAVPAWVDEMLSA